VRKRGKIITREERSTTENNGGTEVEIGRKIKGMCNSSRNNTKER